MLVRDHVTHGEVECLEMRAGEMGPKAGLIIIDLVQEDRAWSRRVATDVELAASRFVEGLPCILHRQGQKGFDMRGMDGEIDGEDVHGADRMMTGALLSGSVS